MKAQATTTKFGFRIRTRAGLVVNNLTIHGSDKADAGRKLNQIYRNCEILDCVSHQGGRPLTNFSYEEVVNLLTR